MTFLSPRKIWVEEYARFQNAYLLKIFCMMGNGWSLNLKGPCILGPITETRHTRCLKGWIGF